MRSQFNDLGFHERKDERTALARHIGKEALRFLRQRRHLQKQILQIRWRHAAACVGQFALKGKQMLNPQPWIGKHTVTFVYFVKLHVAVRRR